MGPSLDGESHLLVTAGLNDYRLGSLLVRQELISPDDLHLALEEGLARGLPVGKVLVLNRIISPNLLRLSVQAQWTIKDKLLGEEEAFYVVQLARLKGYSFKGALDQSGLSLNNGKHARLGELLIKARLLKGSDLKEALLLAQLSDLPLGRVLVARDLVSEALVWHAVHLQEALRRAELSSETATEFLRRVWATLECPSFKLGELLVSARLIKKAELVKVLRLSKELKKSTGDVLADRGFVDEDTLERCVAVQALLRQNRIDYSEAIDCLRSDKEIIAGSTAENDQQRSWDGGVSLWEFLKLVDYLSLSKTQDFVEKMIDCRTLRVDLVALRNSFENRTVKDPMSEIFADSEMLAESLERFYPEDYPIIARAAAIVAQINSHASRVESGLLDYFAHDIAAEFGISIDSQSFRTQARYLNSTTDRNERRRPTLAHLQF